MRTIWRNRSDRGSALIMIAGAMFLLLGVGALAIDLVYGYMARSQAQRAADAAALAGAHQYQTPAGCITTSTGCSGASSEDALAKTSALTIAEQNPVAGLAPTSSTVDVSITYPNAYEPQVTVTVHRDSDRGDPLPTFFGKLFGITTMNVSATATAEAYNPSGTGSPVAVQCLKPFLVPNCDPDHPVDATDPTYGSRANLNCKCQPGGPGTTDYCNPPVASGGTDTRYMSEFFDPSVTLTSGEIAQPVNPGVCTWDWTSGGGCTTGSGIIGEPWQLHTNAAPSQFYAIAFTNMGGEQYSDYIQQCAPFAISCYQPLNSLNGKKVGPTGTAVEDGISGLICGGTVCDSGPDGGAYQSGQLQDHMCSPTDAGPDGNYCTSTPFPITVGAHLPAYEGQTIYSGSNNMVTVAVFDGNNGPLLQSGGGSVTVIGYMQLFIQDLVHNGTDDHIDAVITGSLICNSGNSGSGGSDNIIAAGGNTIPIRLIRTN